MIGLKTSLAPFREPTGLTRCRLVRRGGPDGQTIVFARAPVDTALVDLMHDKKYLTPARGETIADLNQRYRIRFDLYTLPFNHGNGGKPTPLEGASRNGRSNYLPAFFARRALDRLQSE